MSVKTYSYYGRDLTVRELAEIAAQRYHNPISASALGKRLQRMSVLNALKTPLKPQATLSLQYDLPALQQKAWDKYRLRLSTAAIARRLARQWPLEKAISTPPIQTGPTKRYQFQGKLMTLEELTSYAQEMGQFIPKNILRARLGLGWDVSRAVMTPLTRNGQHYYHGKPYTIDQLLLIAHHHRNFINKTALLRRLGRNWDVERAVDTPVRIRHDKPKGGNKDND